MSYDPRKVGRKPLVRLAASVGAVMSSTVLLISSARAENLSQAWNIALTVNQGLKSQQESSVSAGFTVKAAESARYVTIRSYNIDTALAVSPTTKAAPVNNGSNSTSGNGAGNTTGNGTNGGTTSGAGGGSATSLGLNTRVFVLGSNQTFLPISLTTASLPLYTGGRLLRSVDQAQYSLNAQKTVEVRTAIDLKLTVAEAYIGVLRAGKNLETARSNVEQLTSFTRDTLNRAEQQLAIRSDVLAAQVSLSNAQLTEITSRTAVESAYATYNRYLCRPLDAYAPLDEISEFPSNVNWENEAMKAVRTRGEFAGMNDAEARDLTALAIKTRPELAGLGEQARSLNAQAQVVKSAIKPQVSLNAGFVFLGAENFGPQGDGFLGAVIDWTFTDSGKTRRQTESVKAQSRSISKQRADLAADVALQVRTRWLDLQSARQTVPIARFAVIQAEENVKVVTDRYREQLATYTEVLDAEARRVTSLINFYNAVYDENLAYFRLKRAVGDI